MQKEEATLKLLHLCHFVHTVSALSSYQKYLLLNLQQDGGWSQTSAGAFKGGKSCKCLDFTLQASTISRKINYDVTQSRPEGAASLHTPKNPLHPLLSVDSKHNRSNWAGAKRRERRGREKKGGLGGVYSFSYIDDSNIPPASKSPHRGKSSTGNPLVWNHDMRLRAKQGACTLAIHTANKLSWTCSSQDDHQSPKVQTQLQVRWRVGSLSRPSRGVPFPAWYQSQH